MNIIKNKKGMTLVELIVSMGIFAVVMTLTVSFFIAIQKMQIVYRDRANLQQEGRIASEILARYIREAKEVKMTDSAGNIVSELSTSPGLCAGGNAGITLKMPDDTDLQFACTSGVPSRLQMNGSDITSDNINVSSITFDRGGDTTYPKTLNYTLEVRQIKKDASGNTIVSTGEGEKIIFPGYLVMRNEL